MLQKDLCPTHSLPGSDFHFLSRFARQDYFTAVEMYVFLSSSCLALALICCEEEASGQSQEALSKGSFIQPQLQKCSWVTGEGEHGILFCS